MITAIALALAPECDDADQVSTEFVDEVEAPKATVVFVDKKLRKALVGKGEAWTARIVELVLE